jgi:5-methylcytosine-specific restriction endonuclease McrA
MAGLGEVVTFVDTVVSYGLFCAPGTRPTLHAPEETHGMAGAILRDDFNYALARWFIRALHAPADPNRPPYAAVQERVKGLLRARFAHASELDLQTGASRLARLIVEADVFAARSTRKKEVSVAERFQLLAHAEQCCEICGYRFPEEIIKQFINGEKQGGVTYPLYDYLKQTRLSSKHSQIEIDHIHPLAKGGADDLSNLQLLCGFCNLAKRDRLTLFDVGIGGVEIKHPKLGTTVLSSRFLVVRVLVGGRCFKCGLAARERELTIAPISLIGEINPSNVRATCYECDPIHQYRFVAVPA